MSHILRTMRHLKKKLSPDTMGTSEVNCCGLFWGWQYSSVFLLMAFHLSAHDQKTGSGVRQGQPRLTHKNMLCFNTWRKGKIDLESGWFWKEQGSGSHCISKLHWTALMRCKTSRVMTSDLYCQIYFYLRWFKIKCINNLERTHLPCSQVCILNTVL